jgi:hypothetical protein
LRNVEKTISSASNVNKGTEIGDRDDGTVVGLANFEIRELHGAFRTDKRALTTTAASTTATATTATATTTTISGSRGSIFSRSRDIFGGSFGSSDSEETVAGKANYTTLLQTAERGRERERL